MTQTVRCVACNRPVTRPALTMPIRRGMLVWGATCARRIASTRRPSKTGQARDTLTPDMFPTT